MKFEEAMKYLREGKIIGISYRPGYQLQIVDDEVIRTFCLEIQDLFDDWAIMTDEELGD